MKNENIVERYYLPYRKSGESIGQVIKRVDNEISEARFKHICNRDIFIGEDPNGGSRLD